MVQLYHYKTKVIFTTRGVVNIYPGTPVSCTRLMSSIFLGQKACRIWWGGGAGTIH
jgi:hypothetical protein